MIEVKVSPPTLRCDLRNHPGFVRALAALSKIHRDGSGSSLVEFALCSTVLAMFWFGLMQCCLALYAYNCVSDAARSGTRYAAVRGSSCSGMPDCGITATQIQSHVRGNVYPGLISNNLNATATWWLASTSHPTTWTQCASMCNDPGDAVQLQVTYSFPLNIPFWKNQTLNLTSTSQVVIAQ